MAYGKGSFTAQDKILPGMYVNIEAESEIGSVIGARGKVAVAMELDWGIDKNDFIKITAKEFYADSKKILGYDYRDPKMKILREIFKGATEVYIYRLNGDNAIKSTAEGIATAKYAGTRGDAISIKISNSVDGGFKVVTMLDGVAVDIQYGVTASTVKDNDFVEFTASEFTIPEGSVESVIPLKDGVNGTVSDEVAAHNQFLLALEGYLVNVVGYLGSTTEVKTKYVEWVIDQRDVYGNCIQAVLCDQAADHEAIINVEDVKMIPWIMGKSAGCPLNASLQNVTYDGEEVPEVKNSQAELETALLGGKFVLHRVGDEFRVLADINSLVTISGDKTEDFKYNQTIRVIDQINIDATKVWNDNFLGKIPSNDSGRVAFWSDVITILNEYLSMGAIEEYDKNLVTVEAGTQRGSLVMTIPVQVATMLEKAYVTIMVQ